MDGHLNDELNTASRFWLKSGAKSELLVGASVSFQQLKVPSVENKTMAST